MATLKVPVSHEDHIQGNDKALITLVKYADYQCPNCRMANSLIKDLQKHYGQRLRFVFRHFPLDVEHPCAKVAAQIAEFSGSKGDYWKMHDLIFENQKNLDLSILIDLVQKNGLHIKDLEDILENETFMPKIQKDFVGGIKSSVNRTPTLFINGQRYDGNLNYEELMATIDELLKKLGQ